MLHGAAELPIGGEQITRGNAVRLAREVGLSVPERVTKAVGCLGRRGPEHTVRQGTQSQDYGTRLVASRLLASARLHGRLG